MNYYEVGLSDRGLKTHQTLTYSSAEELSPGDLVKVSIRNRFKNGLIISKTEKPTYKTKDIDTVIEQAAVPTHMIELAMWISEYYAVDLGVCLGLIVPRGADKKRRATTAPAHKTTSSKDVSSQLSANQEKTLAAINAKPDTYLLRGVTGSGKTRIYVELTKRAKQQGKGSIILVPEIGLTSQMVDEFISHHSDEVYVLHSHQSEAERHAQWKQIKTAKTPIVIGPRSALFSPIENIGMIVVDEEHETSYKQDVSPKYHAVRVASKLRAITNATLVLGSATPNVEDYYLAEKYSGNILHIDTPVKPLNNTEITLVDIKDRDQFTKNKWISTTLVDQMHAMLDAEKQTLIFHNRRGTSTSVICEDCGWVAMCPNCELPLTHHADWQKIACHVCNHRESVVSTCKDCKQPNLIYKGAGTKEIVSNIEKLFPSARIERFDSDIQDKTKTLEQRYEALLNGEADIIIGTQMIAKGLDLPNIGLVGVINADTALYLPDFSSNERTYQLITQVIGRAGRHQDGHVVIQSYAPKNPALGFALDRNWHDFYASEISDRSSANYPPHTFLLKLTYENKQESQAHAETANFSRMLRRNFPSITVLGPSPAFHYKTRTGWRWQVVVKSDQRSRLVHIAKNVPPNWQFELDPINLL